MKPDANYIFERTRPGGHFIMRKHDGIDIPDFPSAWLPYNMTHYGFEEKYVFKKDMQDIAGVFCISELPNLCYGSFKEDAILLQFRDSYHSGRPFEKAWMSVWFFKGMKRQNITLYYQWISGELILEGDIDDYLSNKNVSNQADTL